MSAGHDDDWPDIGEELRRDLAEGLEVEGTVDKMDILTHVGATAVELVIEASDLEGGEQAGAYVILCDLLATRLHEGVDQVLGCLLFSTEPDAEALVVGLVGMRPETRVFTPVVPLGRAQAEALAGASIAIDDLVDDATSLIAIAADRHPITPATAETLLAELDELIDRRT